MRKQLPAPEPARPDLRLVPAALGAWAATLVGILIGWPAALILAALALPPALLVARTWHRDTKARRLSRPLRAVRPAMANLVDASQVAAPRRVASEATGVAGRVGVAGRPDGSGRAGRSGRTRAAVTGRAGAVFAACAVTVAAALATAAQAHHAAAHPLRAAAADGAAATVWVRLTGDPRPLHQPGYAGQAAGAERVAIAAALRHATTAGGNWRAGGRLLLLAPADGWRGLLPGQLVTAEGLLTPPEGGDLTVAVLQVRGPPRDIGPPPWWQGHAGAVRTGLRDASTVLPERPAGLLPSLVVGDTSALPPAVTEEFRTAGLSHLTAVSGTNVAIICGAVLLLLRLLRVGPRTAAVLAGVALVAFVVVARPSPSVLRAAVMGAVTLLALVLGRNRSAMPALAGAVLVLLMADPELGVEPGFALSVLATGALVLLAPRWSGALRQRGWPAGVAEALAVPVAAHVVTAPVVAAISGKISLVAVVANLLAAPVVAPATVLGALAALLGLVHDGAAEFVVRLAGPFVGWLVTVGHHAAAVPGAAVGWPEGWAGGLLLAAATAGALLLLRLRRLRTVVTAAVAGVLLVLVPTRVAPPGWPATGWAVVACDVGQGDAVALATAEPGRAVVVDTGPEPGPVRGCLDRLGVRRVPLVVLSHLHADHLGGLSALLDGRAVGAVAVGPLDKPKWAFDQVRRLTARAGVPLVRLRAGQRLHWTGLTIDVLGPRHPPGPMGEDDDGTSVNDASLVLRADTAAGRVLLTGDIELAAQSDLLGSGVDLGADILKVPHHGSRYSSPRFLAAVRPRVALVSVGAGNRYHHPNPGVLTMLTDAGATVLRTDQRGDIAITRGHASTSVVARGNPRPPPGNRP